MRWLGKPRPSGTACFGGDVRTGRTRAVRGGLAMGPALVPAVGPSREPGSLVRSANHLTDMARRDRAPNTLVSTVAGGNNDHFQRPSSTPK